jgi:hypothetical protein
MGERRLVRAALAVAIVGIGCVAFAEISEHLLLAAPPRGCRNTPYSSPLEALVHLRSTSFMGSVVWVSGAVGGSVSSLLLVLAGRGSSLTAHPLPELGGPYRRMGRGRSQ